MDARENIIAFINQCIADEVISQEDLLEICSEERSFVGNNTQTKLKSEEVADYLNSREAISLNNFSNVMRGKGYNIKFKATLDRCMRMGCFSYTTRVGCENGKQGRLYYVKDSQSKQIKPEYIIWRK